MGGSFHVSMLVIGIFGFNLHLSSIKLLITFISLFTVGSYLEPPVLTNTLPGGQQPVYGVAVLFDQVFVVRRKTREVEVYDSNTLNLTSRLPVSGLADPSDLTSCSKFRCLYISDLRGGNEIRRVELGGATTRWKVNDAPYGLSVTPDPDFHVLVTCGDVRKLKDFTTNGTLVRQILLQENLANPWHAIQFDGQFIVSHGWMRSEPLHRVCIVNSTSHTTRCYGGPPGSAAGQLYEPRYLATDGEGNVLVADRTNQRVLLLNKTLEYVGELISTRNSGRLGFEPWRLCLDVSRGRLFVTDNRQKDMLVFQVRDEKNI